MHKYGNSYCATQPFTTLWELHKYQYFKSVSTWLLVNSIALIVCWNKLKCCFQIVKKMLTFVIWIMYNVVFRGIISIRNYTDYKVQSCFIGFITLFTVFHTLTFVIYVIVRLYHRQSEIGLKSRYTNTDTVTKTNLCTEWPGEYAEIRLTDTHTHTVTKSKFNFAGFRWYPEILTPTKVYINWYLNMLFQMTMWKEFYYATGVVLFAGNVWEGYKFYWLLLWSIYLSIWLSIGGYYTLYLIYHTLGRDLR